MALAGKRRIGFDEQQREKELDAKAQAMTDDDLIDWLACLAHGNKYWGHIRREILRRMGSSAL